MPTLGAIHSIVALLCAQQQTHFEGALKTYLPMIFICILFTIFVFSFLLFFSFLFLWFGLCCHFCLLPKLGHGAHTAWRPAINFWDIKLHFPSQHAPPVAVFAVVVAGATAESKVNTFDMLDMQNAKFSKDRSHCSRWMKAGRCLLPGGWCLVSWQLANWAPMARRPCARPHLSSIAHCQFYRDRVDDHVAIATSNAKRDRTTCGTCPTAAAAAAACSQSTPHPLHLPSPYASPTNSPHFCRIRFANRQLCIGFTMMSSRDRVNLRCRPATTVHFLTVHER